MAIPTSFDFDRQAKNTVVDSVIALTGQRPAPAPDVVKEFTAAKRLLAIAKGQKRAEKQPVNRQLSFL